MYIYVKMKSQRFTLWGLLTTKGLRTDIRMLRSAKMLSTAFLRIISAFFKTCTIFTTYYKRFWDKDWLPQVSTIRMQLALSDRVNIRALTYILMNITRCKDSSIRSFELLAQSFLALNSLAFEKSKRSILVRPRIPLIVLLHSD